MSNNTNLDDFWTDGEIEFEIDVDQLVKKLKYKGWFNTKLIYRRKSWMGSKMKRFV